VKQSVLANLRQGKRLSGETLGKKLGVSRAAIWKCVHELRRQGYVIDSSPRKGYSLVSCPDLLLPEEISRGLAAQTFGKRIIYRDECASTQDMAAELARGGEPEGLVVIAETQTRGRGRKGRSWISTPGAGICLSVILRPGLKPSQIVQIPLVAGVAAARAIRAVTGLKPDIKWPNDILVGGKKVAGILTEMSCEIDRINHVILGIGINVNTLESDLPEPVRVVATSLQSECGRKISRVALVQRFLTELEAIYRRYLAGGFESIRQEWKSLSKTIGSQVEITDGGEHLTGEALDIDADGFLLLKTDADSTERIVTGDVSLRKLAA
jgi:BirA family biotin operon repressor/biotin-[acetyl-CoA-carboxylase] ligase